ncbi:hypothetical protein OWV82_021965 [Melia azedarach]|uniref:Uncharacterized protein n=1 Tax=Melia azedarach TaxID=155640 RepID=A0ACC1X2M2_MELAZ|nr:hypothetical protein OWV82_021965 [Melia azedarach]
MSSGTFSIVSSFSSSSSLDAVGKLSSDEEGSEIFILFMKSFTCGLGIIIVQKVHKDQEESKEEVTSIVSVSTIFDTPQFIQSQLESSVNMKNMNILESSNFPRESFADNYQQSTVAEKEEEEVVLKHFSSIRNEHEVNLDHPSNKRKVLKVYSTSTRSGNGPLKQIKWKLGRFRIRTVQLGGGVVVVQDEDKDQQ